LDALGGERNELEANLSRASTERDRLRDELHAAEKYLTALQGLSWSLQTQVDDLTIQLGSTQKKLRTAETLAQNTAAQLTTTQQERAAVLKERDALRVQTVDLGKQLESLQTQLKTADAQMTRQTQNYAVLDGKLTTALSRIATLEKDLKEKDALALANAQRAESLSARLLDTDGKLKKTQVIADTVPNLELSVKELRERYAREEALAKQLEVEIKAKVKELVQLQNSLKELREDNTALRADRTKVTAAEERIAALTRDLERVKATGENRFAGVTLTGKRVVFLVDMSGSMDRVDKDTLSPIKWKEVRETLVKVMRSIPELEKFQVILFAENRYFLLGHDEKWLDYDAKTSPEAVLQALAATKPSGGTNMYLGLEAAFKFRAQGLDAVYLLSDGLPNIGPGLAPGQDRLSEVEQGEILGKYMRRLLKTDWNKERPGQPQVKINCLGFFYESPDLGAFLWALARENNGNFVGMSQP
jgi:hypothetical protein